MAEATPVAADVSSIPPAIVHGGDLLDEGLLSDPLLKPGTYIDVESTPPNKVEGKMSDLAVKTEESTTEMQMTVMEAGNITPLRRVSRSTEVNVERPDWLLEDWKFEMEVRDDGPTAGDVDISKAEVQYFLETGGKRKKGNTGAGGDATPSEAPNSKKQKKSASKKEKEKSTNFYFDSANPPESVCWIQTDTCGDTWEPYSNGIKVPAARRQEWDAVYSAVAKLGERNNN